MASDLIIMPFDSYSKHSRKQKQYQLIQPHKSEMSPAAETLTLTSASADLDEVDDVLVVEQLQDLDLPQSCNGELKRCSRC